MLGCGWFYVSCATTTCGLDEAIHEDEGKGDEMEELHTKKCGESSCCSTMWCSYAARQGIEVPVNDIIGRS